MDPIRKLGRRISDVERLAFRASTQPQLAHSAIEDGALQSMDADGNLQAIIGKQYDGTQSVAIINGPVPPMATQPIVEAALEGIRVKWDGLFSGGAILPMNFGRVEAHASTDPDFTAQFADTLIGFYESPRGGTFFASLVPATYYIRLVVRSQSGVRSLVTPPVMVTVAPLTTFLPDASDGEAPSGSPAASVVGGIGAISVRWDAILNDSTVLYDVYVSEDDVAAENFVPGPATLQAHDLYETSYTVRAKLANGNDLVRDGSKRYYARVVAKDVDDAAPAGLGGSDTLKPISGPDVALDYIYGNYIDALQITGTEMRADLTITGRLKTAASGQRTEIGSDGWKQVGPDGVSLRMDFPNDPQKVSYIDAIVNARGLTVNEGMEIRGKSLFAMGSKTILQTQTVGATTGPSLGQDYPICGVASSQWCRPFVGIHADTAESGSTFRTAASFFSTGSIHRGSGNHVFPPVQMTDGVRSSYLPYASTAISIGGAERAVTVGFKNSVGTGPADSPYALTIWDDNSLVSDGSVAPTMKVERLDGSFYWFWQWALGRCFSTTGATRSRWIAEAKRDTINAWPGGNIQLRVFTATDTAITVDRTRTIASSFFAQDERLTGVTFGSSQRMGFQGADEDIWVVHGTVNNYVFTDAVTPVRQPDREFPAIPSTRVTSATGNLSTGDFGCFFMAPNNDGPALYDYTNITWGAADPSIWWGAHTWNDSIGVTHETNASQYSSITMKKRARLTVTVPDLPDPVLGKGTVRQPEDVNSFRFYLTRSATKPVRTDLIRQPQQPADLATSLVITNPLFTGAGDDSDAPPAATNFPNQAPATIESNALGTGSLPKILLTGEGFAHLEALDVGGSGASSFTGKAFDQLYYSIRAQSQLLGGGVKTVDASWNIKWASAFYLLSLGRGANLATDGYFEVTMPPNGTVIPGYGGATPRTVTAGVIPMNAWDILWYEIPYGSAFGSTPGNFRVTNYTGDFTPPNNWIFIAQRNIVDGQVEWVTGENVAAGYDSAIYNIGGQRIKKFNIGNSPTQATNASGLIAVAHGLGTTPSQVLVTPRGGSGMIGQVTSGLWTATTFTVEVRSVTTGAVVGAGVNMNFFFLAIAE